MKLNKILLFILFVFILYSLSKFQKIEGFTHLDHLHKCTLCCNQLCSQTRDECNRNCHMDGIPCECCAKKND